MSKKKNRKIIPYRKPHNINVGMIIFGIIFLYMLFNIFAYFRKDHVQFYEVMEGGIVNNKQYTGLILREEQVRPAQWLYQLLSERRETCFCWNTDLFPG